MICVALVPRQVSINFVTPKLRICRWFLIVLRTLMPKKIHQQIQRPSVQESKYQACQGDNS